QAVSRDLGGAAKEKWGLCFPLSCGDVRVLLTGSPECFIEKLERQSQCCELSVFRALRQEPKWEFQPLASAFADGEGFIRAFSRAVALARNIFPAICNLFPVAERAAKPSEGATFDSRCSRGRREPRSM